MQTRPYIILTNKDLAAIRDGLDHVVSMWCEKWFVNSAICPSVTKVVNAYDIASADKATMTTIGAGSGSAAGKLHFSAEVPTHIYRRATGDNAPRPSSAKPSMIETLLVTKILKDLIVMAVPGQHIASSTVSNPQMKDEQRDVPDDITLHKGSGAVMVKIEDRDWSCDLLLSHGIAQHLTGAIRPKTAHTVLTSRKTVIGHGKIALHVTAGEIELSLSDLLDLKPGHVMRLSQKIDQPFALETVDTQTRICAAYLGQRDGNKAIQLINQ